MSIENSFYNIHMKLSLNIKHRVVPDTDLAGSGYPANNFAGYRISGRIPDIRPDIRLNSKYRNFFQYFFNFFQCLKKLINIYDRNFNLIFYSLKRFLNKFAHSGYPASRISGTTLKIQGVRQPKPQFLILNKRPFTNQTTIDACANLRRYLYLI